MSWSEKLNKYLDELDAETKANNGVSPLLKSTRSDRLMGEMIGTGGDFTAAGFLHELGGNNDRNIYISNEEYNDVPNNHENKPSLLSKIFSHRLEEEPTPTSELKDKMNKARQATGITYPKSDYDESTLGI